MLQKFGLLLQKKIIEATSETKRNGIGVIGSESLLLGLLRLETSVCKYIFSSKKIDILDVEKKIFNSFYLRKGEYTEKFNEVLEMAEKISLADESELIYDEHLFYSLVITKGTVASNIIESFGISLDEITEEVKNIFDFEENEEIDYLVNLTKEAENKKLNPFIGRKSYIERVIRILSKKQKNNPMLIGNAGVGKSALVEGVAYELLKRNKEINVYRLDLGCVIAGTKYRGDLEARLIEVLDKVKNPNTILFIDEIHNIVSNNSENSLDIANILKPILARNEIKCIGATTLDEYYKYIAKDKALSRRFQNIFIEEPNKEEMFQILKGVAPSFEEFYNVTYSKEILKMIIEKAKLLPNRYFPDKAIDILDESGLITKTDNRRNVSKKDVKKIVFNLLGIDYKSFEKSINGVKYFPKLKKYFYNYMLALNKNKTIVNIETKEDKLPLILEDIKRVLKVTNEEILELDFSDYLDSHYSSSLIGAPSGYIGYESGGILTEHVFQYPLSIIIIRNYKNGNYLIRRQLESILKNGWINDLKNRKVYFKNTIFIFVNEEKENSLIGFNNSKKDNKISSEFIDEVIDYQEINGEYYYNKRICEILDELKCNDFYIKVKFNIDNLNDYLKVKKMIEDIEKYQKFKKYLIIKNNNGEIEIKNNK